MCVLYQDANFGSVQTLLGQDQIYPLTQCKWVQLLTASSHFCWTLVSLSPQFWSDLTNVTLTDNSYSFSRVLSLLMCISFAALACTLVFPVSMSDTYQWTHIESMDICILIVLHWITRLTSFSMASGSAKMICCTSFTGCSQHTSLSSSETPVARELESTHISNVHLSTYHLCLQGHFDIFWQ